MVDRHRHDEVATHQRTTYSIHATRKKKTDYGHQFDRLKMIVLQIADTRKARIYINNRMRMHESTGISISSSSSFFLHTLRVCAFFFSLALHFNYQETGQDKSSIELYTLVFRHVYDARTTRVLVSVYIVYEKLQRVFACLNSPERQKADKSLLFFFFHDDDRLNTS